MAALMAIFQIHLLVARSHCPLGRCLLALDWVLRATSRACRVACTELGPAHQLYPPLTTLFTLAQLQKAADPWVLKHSDLEKQDNSWKEVRG